MTRDEYLRLKGVSDAMSGYMIDKTRSNRQFGLYNRGRDKMEKEVLQANAEYSTKRMKAIAEYESLVKKGVIRNKTMTERALTAAHGHEDLDSTHAARRFLDKKGVDWKTGKKKK